MTTIKCTNCGQDIEFSEDSDKQLMALMRPVYDLLIQFTGDERNTIDADESNYFSLVVGEIAKYYEYLLLIWPRYKAISKIYVRAAKLQLSRSMTEPNGHRLLAEDEILELELSRDRQTQLHLEMETIFIFSSILLDRIAASTQYYFGSGSGQWRSFGAMKDHFVGYCENKGLSEPSTEMIEAIQWLHQNVSEFRHLLVVHKHERDYRVRLHFGTGWSNDQNDDEAYFNLGLMYPQCNEVPFISETPQNILKELNKLIVLWVEYLKINRAKRNLSPNA